MSNYLIDFVDDASDDAISAYLTANQCTIIHAYSKLNKVYHVKCDGVPSSDIIVTSIIDDDASPIKLLEIIPVPQPVQARDDVISVEDEKNWWKLYSMTSVDLSSTSVSIPVYGSNTNVYVVDSGIEINHPEFVGQDISLLFSFTGDFNDNTGHGTGLSSLIVGNTCGLTATTVKVVKIFDNNVATKQSDLLHAFDAILQDMLASINKFSVINLSWSIPKNQYIEDKIRHIILAGGFVVASSGNSGTPIGDVTPASMPEVITIGSYGTDFTPSDFSDYTGTSATSLTQNQVNTGALDSWAPGEKIWAATLGGGYGYVAGTSCSAAIYSASIAYNTTSWLNGASDVPAFCYKADGSIDVENFTVAGRTGLLDLSNPKYQGSVNNICTYFNEPVTAKPVPRAFTKIVVRVGETKATPLFNRNFVESYEWLDVLPNWATPELAYLIAAPTNEPTNQNGVDVFEFKYRVYPIGTDPIDCVAQVVVISSTFDREALPTDDPLVDITLAYACSIYDGCINCQNYKLLCTSSAKGNCYCFYTN
jgi:hypothetical protein